MIAPKMPSRTLDNIDFSTRIVPVQKAFSLFTRRSKHRPIHGFRLSQGAVGRNLRRSAEPSALPPRLGQTLPRALADLAALLGGDGVTNVGGEPLGRVAAVRTVA